MPTLSGAERLLLAALAAWSLVPLGLLLAGAGGPALADDRFVFTGSDGHFVADNMQYLAWIREAGEHVLSSNRYDVVDDPALFLHPMFALSGAAWRLGLSLQLALIGWKPLALIVLFTGYAAYVRSRLTGSGERAAALALALFFFTPAVPLLAWTGLEGQLFPTLVIGFELFSAGLVWAVLPTAVTVGLVPLFLLGVERILEREEPAGPWLLAGTAAAGALAGWLHPWQGVTLLLILAGIAAWGRLDRVYLRLTIPGLATLAPILYYYVLSHTDSAWAEVARPNDLPHVGIWLLLGAAPAVALAATELPRAADGVGERLLRLWPLAAVALYFTLESSYIYHAFVGLSLPLAVLSVRAWNRLGSPRLVTAALVALVTLPGMAYSIQLFVENADQHYIPRGEAEALAYLERLERPGSVLAPMPVGGTVPAFTGRRTWVGHYTWTPSHAGRRQRARMLFEGKLTRPEARRTVLESRAAFLLADCRSRAELGRLLGALVGPRRRFGCAAVYEVRRPSAASSGVPGRPRRLESTTIRRPSSANATSAAAHIPSEAGR